MTEFADAPRWTMAVHEPFLVSDLGEVTEQQIVLERAPPLAGVDASGLAFSDMDTLGGSLLRRLDSLDIANSITCAYEDRGGGCRGGRHRRGRRSGNTLHGENLGRAGTD
jgi:hypothetical protein